MGVVFRNKRQWMDILEIFVIDFMVLFSIFLYLDKGKKVSAFPQVKLGLSSKDIGKAEDGNYTQKELKKMLTDIAPSILPDEKASLLDVDIVDKDNKTHNKHFLFIPKTFHYTVTHCFCGGKCQERHKPNSWDCNATCRRICKTSCTVCGTRTT